MKGQYQWIHCMVEKEQYLKGEKGNTGNLEIRAEMLEEGEMFRPLEAHRSNSCCWSPRHNKNYSPPTLWAKRVH